jgi:endonuclease VIII
VPEGDTIAYAASRIRPALEGRVPDEIRTPQARHALDRWSGRLGGRAVTSVDTHGKHLFLRFDGGLAIHSHLGMSGMWGVYEAGRRWSRSPRRAWLILRCGQHEVVEFDGPLLELLTEGRTRFDQRLAALGPDVLAPEFDSERFLRRLRSDDPTRGVGDALLDQRTVAGIGNIWKAEGCWEAEVDPWRTVGAVSDVEALAIIRGLRPRMLHSASEGPLSIEPRVYRRAGRPCPRCGSTIEARAGGAGRSPSGLANAAPAKAGPAPRRPVSDANRTTYWCPGCQG